MELSAIFGKFSKHQIPLCFVYRSRLAFKLQLISMIHSAQIYRMQCSSDCNVAASYLLMFQFEAAPACISNNGGLQFQNCETWLYRWRSFSLYERFWIFNKKKFCSPWVYWKLHLMYALDLDSSWYVLYWSLFKNHLLLYWHKKPCLREHCWLNPKVSPHKVLSNCYHFGKAS